jgi:nucleotide-binding universal stress UspA family protein
VLAGPPAPVIIDAGRDFDLIAMATHGRSGIGRWVYGSVADKVLHGASVPVLLVRARPAATAGAVPPRRILLPLDGSELAEQALPLALALAERAGAELILAQSIASAAMALANPYGYGVGAAELLEHVQAGAQAYLEDVGQRLADGRLTVRTEVRLEPAAEAILDVASEKQADLIVMSTHGRSGVGRWVLGSVADRVLRGTTVPVLLVRSGLPITDETAVPTPTTSA